MEKNESKLIKAIFGTSKVSKLLPGLVFAILLTIAAYLLSDLAGSLIPGGRNPFSPILAAIILGLLVRNLFSLSNRFTDGIKFGINKLLRLGIILMGIRLSIISVLKIGSVAVGMVFICIAAALFITMLLSKKIGISAKLGTLIAAGSSICGVSAVVAVSPAIDADEEETAYAIGIVTIFGLLATITYPYLIELVLQLDVVQAGFFLGTSVHDTSQVTGTALIYDQLWGHKTTGGLSAADIAITTKLVRNTFMIAIIPFLGYWMNRKKTGKGVGSLKIAKYIPLFILGYILFGILRSIGDYIFGYSNAAWLGVCGRVMDIATYAIAVAITCVGLNTNLKKLATLGMKPLLIGFAAAASVGAVSFVLVTVFAGFLHF